LLVSTDDEAHLAAVVVYTDARINPLYLGIPLRFDLTTTVPSVSYSLLASTTNETRVIVSPIGGLASQLSMRITHPATNREWPATMSDVFPEISFFPLATELSEAFLITVSLKSANVSFLPFSITALSVDDDQHPVYALDGLPQFSQLEEFTEQYYKWSVPADATGVEVSVNSIYGDADVFINPCDLGFYHRTREFTDHSDPFPVYSSQSTTGRDVVTIPSSALTSRENLCITVYGYRSGAFVFRAITDATIITLTESWPVFGAVRPGSYRYFRFLDTDPSREVQFDVNPSVGDVDLFIGCLLEPTGSDLGYPSQQEGHYNYSSTMYLEDAISISPTDRTSCSYGSRQGVFYLAIAGSSFYDDVFDDEITNEYADCEFSLTSQHADGVQTLTMGVPMKGRVFKRESAIYRLRLGRQAESLTVTVTPYDGDVDLYLVFGQTKNWWEATYKSVHGGTAIDSVTIFESDVCVDCWVSVFVVAFASSRFTIVASLEDSTVSLLNGSPLKGSVGEGQCQYYSMVASSNGTAEGVLTILTGSANLYLSTVNSQPCESSLSNTVIAAYGESVFPFIYANFIRAGKPVYVGVGGLQDNASYTIRLTLLTSRALRPTSYALLQGIPQSDVILTPNEWKYYTISLLEGHESMSVRWTSFVDDVAVVYVSACRDSLSACYAAGQWPNATHYLETSKSSGLTSITIDRNDGVATTYIIGVTASAEITAYSLSYTMASSILQLSPGISVIDHVYAGEVDYFSFFMPNTQSKVIFTLTTLAGDPDLYISTIASHPSRSNFTWSAIQYGDDEIVIDPSIDTKACLYCRYFIAVVGTSEASYSLVAHLESVNPSLVNGIPASGHVALLDWKYYVFTVRRGAPVDLEISLITLSGNADLYATLDGSEPSWTNYAYTSYNWGTADDLISIAHNDPSAVSCLANTANTLGCLITIGINGLADSDYIVTVTSSTAARLLQQHIPMADSINQESYNYYKTPILAGLSTGSTFRLQVTMNGGEVMIYFSCLTDSPDKNSHQWEYSPTTSDDDFTLPFFALDDASTGLGRCKDQGYLYLSVYGVTSAAYSILASTANDSSTYPTLLPGSALDGSVAWHHFQWYFVRPGPSYDDILLTCTIYGGDIAVYVSADYERKAFYESSSGTVQSYLLSASTINQDSSVLRLNLNHNLIADSCKDRLTCYFLVGIFGLTASAYPSPQYDIAFQLQDSTVMLADGVPVRGIARTGQYQYFRYTLVTQYVDLVLALTTYGGDSDLFVAVGYRPSRYNSTWYSTRYGADVITLQSNDIAQRCHWSSTEQQCDFSIAVYGYINSSFSLTATASNGFASRSYLIDGQPQQGMVALGGYTYYEFDVSITESIFSSIVISLTSIDEHDADLYVSFSGEPGVNSYDYKSNLANGIVDQITISSSMAHYCTSCKLYIAVYGFTADTYSIVASVKNVPLVLANHPNGGIVNAGEFMYFRYFNFDEVDRLTFTLNIVSGDSDLYISTYNPNSNDPIVYPDQYTYTWRSLRSGNDIISIDYLDAHYCAQCDYLIGVYGFHNSSFSLIVSEREDAVLRLIPSLPLHISVKLASDQSLTRYFIVDPPNSIDDVLISATPMTSGFVAIYAQVYNTSVPYSSWTSSSPPSYDDWVLPDPSDPSTYRYSTAGTFDGSVVIPGGFAGPASIIAAVVPQPQSSMLYSILASTSSVSVVLQTGVPQNHFVESGQNAFFVYYPSEEEDLMVSVTARSGDPDLLISRSNPRPHCSISNSFVTHCSNYTYLSRKYSTDQIAISKDFPCKAMLPGTSISEDCNPREAIDDEAIYIGVFGFSSAKFTITVTTSGMVSQLTSSIPQLASTSAEYDCSDRDPRSGSCVDDDAATVVQAAYFAYHVYPSTSSLDQREVLVFSVKPVCETTSTSGLCPSISVYLTSCAVSKCTEVDAHPSSLTGQNKYAIEDIDADIPTTIIVDPFDDSLYCDANEECIYYLSVHGSATDQVASFLVAVRTPGSVALVPCDSRAVDGFRSILHDEVIDEISHSYEICSQTSTTSDESLMVSLEQCSGESTIYLCAEVGWCDEMLPSTDSWMYRLTQSQACSVDDEHRQRCSSLDEDDTASTYPLIMLPQDAGNYFVRVVGEGEYQLHIQSTLHGEIVAAQLKIPDTIEPSSTVSPVQVADSSARLRWMHVQVRMPGHQQFIDHDDSLEYTIYAIDNALIAALQPSLIWRTPCALQSLRADYPSLVYEVVSQANAAEIKSGYMTRTISALKPEFAYTVIVQALCDESCLRQIAKTNGGGPCLLGCQRQYYLYPPIKFTTTAAQESSDSSSSSYAGVYVAASIAALIAIALIFSTIFVYYRRVMQTDSDQPAVRFTEMVNRKVFGISGSSVPPGDELSFSSHAMMSSSSSSHDVGMEQSYRPPSLATSVATAARNINTAIRAHFNPSSAASSSSTSSNVFNPMQSQGMASSSTYSKLWSKRGQSAQDDDDEVEISL
jgi:hypothetical protein